MELDAGRSFYAELGFSRRTGFGERPALLVVDMSHGCADPSVSPIAIAMDEQIGHIARLLALARDVGAPVVFTTVVYRDDQLRDGGWFVRKIPALEALRPGTKAVEIVPALAPRAGELLVEKQYASAFFGTGLASYLTACGVDTVVVTGNSTSGCVRATVVDAVSSGFRVVVPRQCVADRVPLTHAVNLFDMDSKYADVVEVADVIVALEKIRGRRGEA
jgi:maleamate amidohydrolase